MILRILLVVHAVITFAAGAVLVVVPAAIPNVINVHLAPDDFILCYFLAAAEVAVAYLSLCGLRYRRAETIRVIVSTIIVFHIATAALEIYALAQGADAGLWSNVALRVIVSGLFLYFGLLKYVDSEN